MSTQTRQEESADVRSIVRERYGKIAEQHQTAPQVDCGCSTPQNSCCGPDDAAQMDAATKLYEDPGVADLPEDVTNLSLGCGDPVTLASLTEGQTVLDLGSGGGIDCFLAAKKVGPAGRVIGVDMTSAMIERARANKIKVGAENVEFRLGEIEHLPVADETADVIISNCVVNLSPDKPQVFREAFRVMRPGGRLAVSDIVTDGPLPDVIKNSLSAWAGCIAGALEVKDYVAAIEAAGFVDVEVAATYWDKETIDAAIGQLDPETARQVEEAKKQGKTVIMANEGVDGEVAEVNDTTESGSFDLQKAVFSAKITARKPK